MFDARTALFSPCPVFALSGRRTDSCSLPRTSLPATISCAVCQVARGGRICGSGLGDDRWCAYVDLVQTPPYRRTVGAPSTRWTIWFFFFFAGGCAVVSLVAPAERGVEFILLPVFS